MKRITTFLFLVSSIALHASGVRVLQAEYMRDRKWQPDYAQFPGITWIQGTPDQALAFPGVSDHATQVARILLSGPTKPSSMTTAEAVTFTGRSRGNIVGLNGGSLLDSVPAQWDIENHSWGGSDPLFMDDSHYDGITYDAAGNRVLTPITQIGILNKEARRLERDNVLAFVALPNPGDGKPGDRLLSAAISPNIVKIASSKTGYVGGPGMVPDVYAPVDWNSFATPTVAQVGISLVDWCKSHDVAYKAADLRTIIISSAHKDPQGRSIVDPDAAMAALQRFYASKVPAPVPASTPTPAPAPLPVPVVVAPPPAPAPTPAPVPTPTPPAAAPIITQIGHWNSAWASPKTPSTLYWKATGATRATLTDPTGQTIDVPTSGTFTTTTACSGYVWVLSEYNGEAVTQHIEQVHGQIGGAK